MRYTNAILMLARIYGANYVPLLSDPAAAPPRFERRIIYIFLGTSGCGKTRCVRVSE